MAVEFSALDRDSLHIYVSILAFLFACFVFRTKANSWRPWFAVLALAVFGEYVDGQSLFEMGVKNYPSQETLWRFHGKDMINTMIAPTILVLAARYTGLFEKPEQPIENPPEEVIDDGES